jgi:hypothetical protein
MLALFSSRRNWVSQSGRSSARTLPSVVVATLTLVSRQPLTKNTPRAVYEAGQLVIK